MMKQIYESPELVIDLFFGDDVMTASFGDNDLSDPWG